MLSLSISPDAERDLDDIWNLAASHHQPPIADRLIEAIANQFELFQSTPTYGRQKNDLRANLRSFRVESFLIFYQATDEKVEIVRILHCARDITAILDEED